MIMDKTIAKKIDAYFSQFKHQLYKKGEILVRADDNPQGVFYLKSGTVKEYVISKKGEELIVNIFKPVSFFPMSWAMNSTPNKYFFEAVTDIEVFRVPQEKTVAFVKENSDILYDLLSRVYKGTDGLLLRMAYLMSGNAYDRLVTELIIHGKRFGKKDGEKIEVSISEKELAAQSGMTRETVSREIKLLKNKGLVTFEKNTLIIKDLDKLEAELLEEA